MIDDEIIGNDKATPWHRAQALYQLITGATPDMVKQALLQERPAA